ncbi:rab3 gtpase-activating protein catalytic subunit [Anaeramoeba flamelloides]|uniref:Rab3 GTPase-activating protein catalytic subunit n=1 Tax=Anaeramoeba flamelloides TaxID=1746091 RepID=A0ABQ8Y410_9EUKA|nr:rab3 gtpase-activating protein catalytic subunit [Anaeramoeba flamelloides]
MNNNSNSPISSDQEDPIESDNITVPTDWEQFISELELTLCEWGLSKGEELSEILNPNQQIEHTLKFDNKNYLLKYYNHLHHTPNEKEKKPLSSHNHKTQEQIKKRSNDFLNTQTTNIPSLFGVTEFLLLQPESEVMSISLATCILSSCILSINSCESQIPIFLPVYEKEQELFLGYSFNKNIRIMFENEIIQYEKSKQFPLNELLSSFSTKLELSLLKKPIEIYRHPQFIYDLYSNSLPINKRYLGFFPIPVQWYKKKSKLFELFENFQDPILKLQLYLEWEELTSSSLAVEEIFDSLTPQNAVKWEIKPIFHEKYKKQKGEKIFGVVGKITSKLSKSSGNELFLPKYTQNDLLVMLFTEENNLQRSFSNDLQDHHSNKNTENKLINKKQIENLNTKNENENEKGKEKGIVHMEVSENEKEKEKGKGNEKENENENEKEKQKGNKIKKGNSNINNDELKKTIKKLDYLLKTCPKHCLLSEFALYCAFQDSLRDVASLWKEFCRAISWYCKSNRLIPKIPVASPDLGCCVLYQKLQFINLCIEKNIRLAKRNEMENNSEKNEGKGNKENKGDKEEEKKKEEEKEEEKEEQNLNRDKSDNTSYGENKNEKNYIEKEDERVEEINGNQESKEKKNDEEEDLETLDLDILDDFGNDYNSSETESLNDDISSLSSSESDEDPLNIENNSKTKNKELISNSENENNKEDKEDKEDNDGKVGKGNEKEEGIERGVEKKREKENGGERTEMMNQEDIIRELTISKITPIFDSQKLVEDKVVYERVGNKRIIEGLTLIKTGEEMWEPETQEPLYLTEDTLQAQLELFVKLGTDKHATDIRAKIQSVQLLSDMQAFKAANPGCILEDFVRWYSPRDFIQTTYSKTGELSERMKKAENIWVKTWNYSKAIPAKDQNPLFDPIKESENALSYLENLKPNELLEQISRIAIQSCLSMMISSPLSSTPKISRYITKLVKSITQVYKHKSSEIGKSHFNKLLKKFKKVELELVKAHSILKKFNEKDEFLQRYLNSKNGMIQVKTESERELISNLYNYNKRGEKEERMATKKLVDEDEDEDEENVVEEENNYKDNKNKIFLNSPSLQKYILRTTVPRPIFSETPLVQRYSTQLFNGKLKISSSFSEEYL